jgi:hypothetical protein
MSEIPDGVPERIPARSRPGGIRGWVGPVVLGIGFLAVGFASLRSAFRAPTADPELQRLVHLLSDPATPSLDLVSAGARVGRVVLDAERHRLFVFAPGLAAPAPGKTRVLWFLDLAGAKATNAGAFRAEEVLGADAVLEDAPSLREVGGFGVTDESDARGEKPSAWVARSPG